VFYRTLKPQDFSNLDGRQESEPVKILEGCGLFEVFQDWSSLGYIIA